MDVEKEIGIASLQVEQSFQSASHCTDGTLVRLATPFI